MQRGDSDCNPIEENPSVLVETEFRRLVSRLEVLSRQDRGQECVALSAMLLEYAAFELAPTSSCEMVGRLVELSAELTRKGNLVSKPTKSGFLRNSEALQ